jgi:hypothetical protein
MKMELSFSPVVSVQSAKSGCKRSVKNPETLVQLPGLYLLQIKKWEGRPELVSITMYCHAFFNTQSFFNSNGPRPGSYEPAALKEKAKNRNYFQL